MFVARNTVDELERGRRLTAVTNNLAALVGLLVLGFPISPASIRTMVAGSVLAATATLEFLLRQIGTPLRVMIRAPKEDLKLRGNKHEGN